MHTRTGVEETKVSSDKSEAVSHANPADHPSLARSMSDNFTGVYLTMLSIIQGVALTDLANITFSNHAAFALVNWIQVATMLWSIIYIWNHFMGDALMTHWIPDIVDAALLFGTGVLELVANHAIVWGVTAWLATMAIMLFAWSGGMFYIRAQEERVVQDPILMDMLRWRTRPVLFQTLGGGVVLGALTIATHFESAIGIGAVAIAVVVSIVIGTFSSLFWRAVRHYAYTGEAPQ